MSDDNTRNVEIEGEEADKIFSVLDQVPCYVGFGFLICEAVNSKGEIAGRIVPTAPDGSISVSYVIDKHMLAGIITNLQKLQESVTWVYDPMQVLLESVGTESGNDNKPN